jgi:predicted ester cyclase
MSEANKTLVRRHFEEIFNQRNFAVGDEMMANDYTEHAVAPFGQSEPGRVNGPQHIRSAAEWLLAQFPALHMRVEMVVAEGDLVSCRVFSEGTNLGKLNDAVSPTGRRFAGWQCHWFRVTDNKLAEHWATRDDLPAMLQLGIIQPPGPPR